MISTSNGIHVFPIERIVRRQLRPDNENYYGETTKERVNRIVDDNATILAMQLQFRGIDIHSEEFENNFALSIEFLRATLYKSYDIKHPLHTAMTELIHCIIEETIQ